VKHLSVSAIQDYLTCPLLWHGRRVARWPQEPSAPMQIGIAIHEALSAHHRGEDAEVALVKRWGATVTHPRGAGQIEPALAAVRAYCAVSGIATSDKPDWRFTLRLPGLDVPVIGFLDVLRPGAILEFKTTARPGSWNQDRVDTEFQATVYAMAFRDQNKAINPTITYTILGVGPEPTIQTYVTGRTDGDMLKARMLIRGVYEAMTSEKLEARCDPSRCQFPDHCAEFGLKRREPKPGAYFAVGSGSAALSGLLEIPGGSSSARVENDPFEGLD
jgi:hypothetical protein